MRVRFSHHIFRIEPYGGVSRYIAELHRGLLTRGVDSRVVAPLHVNAFIASLDGVTGIDVSRVRPQAVRQAVAKLVDTAWAAGSTRRLGDDDITHMTYFDSRLPSRGRIVTTVYDMVHELHPEGIGPRDGTIDTKRRTCEAADLVLAISERTRTDLLERYPLDPDLVVVTPLGIRALSLPAGHPSPHPAPFVLYVGNRSRSYKNFAGFAAAVAGPAKEAGLDLVCFGGGPFTDDETQLLTRLGLAGRTYHATGDDALLARHYASAVALVYPSYYEGFGLPPLEAMAYGCPVAAAAVGAIPETSGPAALLFDPTDRDAVTAAMNRIIHDDALRASLAAAGPQRAAEFSWDTTAEITLAAYQRCVMARPKVRS